MHPIQLNDQLYLDAQRRADDAGFLTVDEYVSEVLRQVIAVHDAGHAAVGQSQEFDGLFTPERLAKIDRAVAEIDAGEGIPSAEVRRYFQRKISDER